LSSWGSELESHPIKAAQDLIARDYALLAKIDKEERCRDSFSCAKTKLYGSVLLEAFS